MARLNSSTVYWPVTPAPINAWMACRLSLLMAVIHSAPWVLIQDVIPSPMASNTHPPVAWAAMVAAPAWAACCQIGARWTLTKFA